MQKKINLRRVMRYGYLVKKPTLESGLPIKENSRGYQYDYLKTIFRKLLVCDQTPGPDWQKAVDEACETLRNEDPAFYGAVSSEYLDFIKSESCIGKWQKIKQDNNFFIKDEEKRRSAENPYHNFRPCEVRDWNELPQLGRAYKNKPWQFARLYKDIHFFCLKLLDFLKTNKPENPESALQDYDTIRLKINSILAADKMIYALDSAGNKGEYLDGASAIVDLKLSLDGFKLSETFLERAIESLHKIKWSVPEKTETALRLDAFINFGLQISDALRDQIRECERRLILFMNMENGES